VLRALRGESTATLGFLTCLPAALWAGAAPVACGLRPE